jgi:protein-tyrosine-phosphatase/DNA-binding transcriptional ArsR family regulator
MANVGQVAPPPFVRLAAHPLRWRLLAELARSDLRVRELVALVDQPQNLVSYHLRLLRSGGLLTATRSSFDGRDSYYHLDLERCAQALADAGAALHPGLRRDPAAPAPPANRPHAPRVTVLFVCTGNSARSPIAEALLRRHTGGRVEAASAGSRPKPRIHPHAVRVLREHYGINITDQQPRPLDSVADRRFDYLITLCDKAREVRHPIADHPRLIHWSINDPATVAGTDRAGYPAFLRTAAEVDTRVRYLVPLLAAEPHQEAPP